MTWILLSTLAALFFSISNLTDKVMLGRLRYPHTVNIVGSFMIGTVALIIAFARPVPISIRDIVIALIIGVLGFLAVSFYLIAVKKEEASRVSPLWSGTDMLVPLLAFFFLREPLTVPIVWAIILIVIGSILIESDLKNGIITRKPMVLILMFTASLSWAIGVILARQFLINLDALTLWVWSAFGAVFCGLISLTFSWRKVRADLHERLALTGTAISTGTEAIGVIAKFSALALFYAAPVTLVGASQFVLVFAGALIFSRWFPQLKEKTDRYTIGTKLLAIALIIAGVTIVAATE